jgi:hypothetical protein
MKKLLLLAGAAAFIATPALADLPAELSVGQTHAGMAATQADINMVHVHLQHALNCLVGPTGAGFDAAHGNPCAKAFGNGAIADAADAGQKSKLEAAAASARSGIASTDLATAQKDAQATADGIGSAKQ